MTCSRHQSALDLAFPTGRAVAMETALAAVKARPPAPVQITVLRALNVKGIKGDLLMSYIRSEFNNSLLGDSPKLEASPDRPTEFNFTSSFDVTPDGPHSLDDVAHKPVVLTLIEVLPKEKKQKEEKTVVLGQAAVDLLPLLKGECNFKVTLPLYPATGSPLEGTQVETKPSLEVAVCVPDPLLSDAQINDGNILRVTVESVYCAPESWNTTGPAYNYVMSLQMPPAGELPHCLVFSNGALKAGGEADPVPRPKKWSVTGMSAAGALNIPDSFILGGPYEEENGELNRKEDKEFRADAETLKKRVTWDTERRRYLDPSALLSIQKQIAECRYWPVEIMRTLTVAPNTKGKPGKVDKGDEDGQISFHGVAYINMVPLLYPGVKHLRGAFRISPYQDAEVLEKTKCQSSALRDIARQTGLQSRVGFAPAGVNSPHGKQAPSRIVREDKVTKDKDNTRKTSAPGKPLDTTSEAETIAPVPAQTAPQNVEGQQYTESGTYVVLELSLEKPLVPKRLAEEIDLRVRELIPSRPQLPRRNAGAAKAVMDYHNQISSITNSILEEYCALFGKKATEEEELDQQALEEQKCQLNYELNCTGKYFAFKEQLKHAVVKIVREKYLKTTAFEDPEQLQAFLSELYVYLVDQMHISLNKTLFDDRGESAPPPMTDTQQLLRFAREAEITGNFHLANTFYQERLARDRQCVDHWLDYGSFNLLTDDYIKAQECFHEAVALKRDHLPSLLLCGTAAAMLDHYKDAEVFFEDATCTDPTSSLAWTMLGLFYEMQGNDIRMEMAFSEAARLHQATLSLEGHMALSGVKTAGGASSKSAPDNASEKVSKGATEGPRENVPTSSRAESPSVNISLGSRPVDEKISLTRRVSVSSLRSKSTKAATHKEVTAAVSVEPEPQSQAVSIFMEAAQFLAQVNALQFVQRALAHDLLSPDGGPTCRYHLMCAQMHLKKKELEKAEQNLQEASQINHQNPDVWALKGHMNFLIGRKNEARDCYEHTLSLVIDASDTHPVYLRLGSIYLDEEKYEKAKNTYLLACKQSPTCLTWLGAGIACYRLEEMEEAEDALSEANALNNNNAEVWGYLTLVCLKTGRQLEAEQSYKYTRKLNLQNEDLLTEIHTLQEEVGFGDPAF
ncbi:cilia- and flagella-associated protein 70 isoform X2 [Xenopus laevis]|uniref:Cilia- and flagella-associated protein 70 isoform X2 n=2 Tax=Xenopus laevis TaxID=8355 RepID=A0A8J1LSA1_XENLA|nr:cilia- and flagella-associated protein 70 isoform X2 [Xenopus laevis]